MGRNPVVAGLAAAVVLLLVVGSVVSTWFGVTASRHARDAQQRLARNCVLNGNRLREAHDWAGALLWYVEALKLDPDDPETIDLHRRRIGMTLRRFTPLCQLWRLPEGERYGACNGQHLLTIDREGAVHVRQARTGEVVGQPLRLDSPIRLIALSGDGQRVVTVAGEPGEGKNKQPASARLWKVAGRPARQPRDPSAPRRSQRFAGFGRPADGIPPRNRREEGRPANHRVRSLE